MSDQITRYELARMTPEQIIDAQNSGRLTDILTAPRSPFAGLEDALVQATEAGHLDSFIDAVRRNPNTDSEEEN